MKAFSASPIKRVVILWEHLTDYMLTSITAVLANPAIELLAVQRIGGENVQTALPDHPRLQVIDLAADEAAAAGLLAHLTAFRPDIALITGTSFSLYRQAAHKLDQQGCMVVWASDRIRRKRLNDGFQAVLGHNGRWSHYHAAFVPGQAGAAYAHFIGFPENLVFTGLYSGNTALFHPIGEERHQQQTAWPRAFLFVGQLIPRKGIDTLRQAYNQYRQQNADPWELFVVGTGPLQSSLDGLPGVRCFGYLPPPETAVLMSKSGCFILPSRWDHWGVVIHEAACAGLPILATTACGAAADLVEEGKNGFLLPPEQPALLADLMQRVTENDNGRSLGQHSLQLSYQFTPALFARTLLETIPTALQTVPQ
ncbi:MAG: glycosyltransferase family 4 protein [Anaerolineae bacterium]|nr:glycosyltransferase family 4 protein [Anaerolineae bacterium]